MTDKRFEELARRFGVSPEEVRKQWEIANAQGADAVLEEMDGHLAEEEKTMNEVIATISTDVENRYRAMGDFYHKLMEELGEPGPEAPADLALKLAILLFRQAESNAEIERLRGLVTGNLDGNRRAQSPK